MHSRFNDIGNAVSGQSDGARLLKNATNKITVWPVRCRTQSRQPLQVAWRAVVACLLHHVLFVAGGAAACGARAGIITAIKIILIFALLVIAFTFFSIDCCFLLQ